MERKFDFVIHDDAFSRDILRFYPRRSHVHGYTDEPPTSWKAVYKVYYSWAVIRHYYYNGEIEPESGEKLFDMPMDECSELPELSEIIKYVVLTGEPFDSFTVGQPAGEWCIKKEKCHNIFNDSKNIFYEFQVFNNLTNQGYRFCFNEIEALEFCDWIDAVNQYMLEHSEGI